MTPLFQSKAGRTALGGILTAVNLTLLYLAAIAPSGRIGVAAVAGLCPVLGVLLVSRSTGYLIWIASSILALILVPEKGIALCYLALLGLYPVVKSHLEGLSSRILEWVFKLVFGMVGLVLMRYLLLGLMMQSTPDWMSQNLVFFYPVGILVFIAYDVALTRLIALVRNRVLGRR